MNMKISILFALFVLNSAEIDNDPSPNNFLVSPEPVIEDISVEPMTEDDLFTTVKPINSTLSSSTSTLAYTTTTTTTTSTTESTTTTTTTQPTTTTTTTTMSTTSTTTLPPPPINPKENCFWASPELCLGRNNSCYTVDQNYIVCCNICCTMEALDSALKNFTINGVNSIHIQNLSLNSLNLSSTNKYFKQLNSLAITDGTVKVINGSFNRFTTIKCLNFSNNGLAEISGRPLIHLTKLQYIDLSYNELTFLTSFPNNLIKLDTRGNNDIPCRSIQNYTLKVVDLDYTLCLVNTSFNWFNSSDHIPLRHLENMKQLKEACPVLPGKGKCICELERLNYELSPNISFGAKVDCSGMQLIQLPEDLPVNTISLNVSHNNITSLAALSNSKYDQLRYLYADDNLVESLDTLEGTKFMEEFAVLFLRRNKLKNIPIYFLQNTMDKNPSGRLLYLEGNRLFCDCNSAKTLKEWLLSRQTHMQDYDKILCDNIPQNVHELSETKLCQSPHDWTNYITLLIVVEVFLLVALIVKVSYDYWIFRTAGYLPWPASRMPKLPCDWLCES